MLLIMIIDIHYIVMWISCFFLLITEQDSLVLILFTYLLVYI